MVLGSEAMVGRGRTGVKLQKPVWQYLYSVAGARVNGRNRRTQFQSQEIWPSGLGVRGDNFGRINV